MKISHSKTLVLSALTLSILSASSTQAAGVQPFFTSKSNAKTTPVAVEAPITQTQAKQEKAPTQPFFSSNADKKPVLADAGSSNSIIDVAAVRTTDNATEIHVTTNGLVRQPKARKEDNQLILTFDNLSSNVSEKHVLVKTNEVESIQLNTDTESPTLKINLAKYGQFTTRIVGNTFILKIYPSVVTTAITVAPTTALTGINFTRSKGGEEKAIISVNNLKTPADVKQVKDKILVTFKGSQFPSNLVRNRFFNDTKAVYSSAKTYNQNGNGILELSVNGSYDYVVYQLDNQVVINVGRKVAMAAGNTDKAKQYSGKKLSMDFQNADIRRIIQVMAEHTGQNIVASDSVEGTISLRLNDVPWEQALNIISKSKGLAQRRDGNVILVAPLAEITRNEALEATAYSQSMTLSPLVTKVVQLNYANAKNVADMLRPTRSGLDNGALNQIRMANADESTTSLLSSRGSVSIDERTNTIAITDTNEKINVIKSLVEQIDVPVRQVMIEARIVRASTNFSKAIGVKWGLLKNSGLTMASDMNNLTTQYNNKYGGQSETIDRNVNLDLGQTMGTSGIALGLINTSKTLLGLELSALQSDGLGEVLSKPKILTGDKQEARISSGVKLPYQSTSDDNGTTTVFQEALLELLVTPSITPDGTVQMKLEVSKDTQGSLTDMGYAIDTNKLKTNVLVNDGETVVLGGLFEETRTNDASKVPLLGDIPVLGHMFKSKSRTLKREELLIFVTPTIINDPTAKNTLANLGDSKLISSIKAN